jgi:hypothetical protein
MVAKKRLRVEINVENTAQEFFINVVTNLFIVEIDRKFAGIMWISGISRSNSASMESIRFTMSNEVRPASRRSSSEPTVPEIERSVSNRRTTSATLFLGELLRGSNVVILSNVDKRWK